MLSNYGLQDIEQVRLVLNGHSIVDWRQMALRDVEHVEQLLALQGVDLSHPDDVVRLNRVHEQAVEYVNANFDLFQSFLGEPPEVFCFFARFWWNNYQI